MKRLNGHDAAEQAADHFSIREFSSRRVLRLFVACITSAGHVQPRAAYLNRLENFRLALL
jgi:hypothetical protein